MAIKYILPLTLYVHVWMYECVFVYLLPDHPHIHLFFYPSCIHPSNTHHSVKVSPFLICLSAFPSVTIFTTFFHPSNSYVSPPCIINTTAFLLYHFPPPQTSSFTLKTKITLLTNSRPSLLFKTFSPRLPSSLFTSTSLFFFTPRSLPIRE